ncbi:hypothetical protein [Thiohalophilus sp.]|nr:hypothetical protein [Thiohalophilus sp.]MDZ7661064.1 hypothetical protein [Thiohalophilus sp.]
MAEAATGLSSLSVIYDFFKGAGIAFVGSLLLNLLMYLKIKQDAS